MKIHIFFSFLTKKNINKQISCRMTYTNQAVHEIISKNINQQILKFNPIFLSIKNETNIDELINRIKDKLKNKFVSLNETLITRERHRQSLEACVQNLINFEEKNSQEDFDKAAEDLRLATRHLGMIVGKVDVEEILGSIFNDFCIGK